jgi:hypothetical protein
MEFEHDKYIHHRTILPNGQRIREIGLEAWLIERKERWTCIRCGKGYTWFEEKCKSCGSELLSVKKEFGSVDA